MQQVAALLVAKGQYSYYLASTGWFDYDWQWHPKAFDKKYGTPHGPATHTGGTAAGGRTYARKYSGCDVRVVCPAAKPLGPGVVQNWRCKGTVTMK